MEDSGSTPFTTDQLLDAYPMERSRVIQKRPMLFEVIPRNTPFTVTTNAGKLLHGNVGDFQVFHANGDVGIIAKDILADRVRYQPLERSPHRNGRQLFRNVGHVRAVQHPYDAPSVRLRTREGITFVHPGEWVLEGSHDDQWAIADNYVGNYLQVSATEQRGHLASRKDIESQLNGWLPRDRPAVRQLIHQFHDAFEQEVRADEVVDRVRLFVLSVPPDLRLDPSRRPTLLSDLGWMQVRAYTELITHGSSIQQDALRIVMTKQAQNLRYPKLLRRSSPSKRATPGLPEHPTVHDLRSADPPTLYQAHHELDLLEGTYAAVSKLVRVRLNGLLFDPLGTRLTHTSALLSEIIEHQPDRRDPRQYDQDERWSLAIAAMTGKGRMSPGLATAIVEELPRVDFGLVLRDVDAGFKALYTRGDWTDTPSGPGRLRTVQALIALEGIAKAWSKDLGRTTASDSALAI